MEEKCVEKYGMSGTFFSTNQIYLIPHAREEDWHPFPEMLEPDVDWDTNSGSGSDETALTDVLVPAVPAAPALPEGEEGAAVAPPPSGNTSGIEGPNAEQRATGPSRSGPISTC
jgi:hypothetical protein